MERQSNEFSKYLKIFYRRRFLFIAASLLVMTVAIVWSYLLPRQYKAASTVFIEKSILDELVKGIAIAPAKDNNNQVLQVLRYDMLSREVLSKVLREMDADTPLANEVAFQELVDDLQKRTEITIKGKEGLFIVSFKDKNPKFAQAYVNTLVRTYVEQNMVANGRKPSVPAGSWMNNSLFSRGSLTRRRMPSRWKISPSPSKPLRRNRCGSRPSCGRWHRRLLSSARGIRKIASFNLNGRSASFC
jgi:uncharacterized protein involved in exopolysaccharide biosynthesis